MRLDGQVAVVTGGARGNGAAIGKAYLDEGATVVLVDVNPEVKETAAGMAAGPAGTPGGGTVSGAVCDITDAAAVEAMVAAAVAAHGRIDILVNNAGIMPQAPFLEVTPERWRQVHAVNLDGAFFCGQSVARRMVEAGAGGVIINITSKAGTRGGPNNSAYCSSKGGLTTLTKAMAVDLAPHRIRVNAIAPALIITEMNREMFAREPARLAKAVATIPWGRPGQPDDLVGLAVFLAAGGSEFITGAVIPVDGGATAR